MSQEVIYSNNSYHHLTEVWASQFQHDDNEFEFVVSTESAETDKSAMIRAPSLAVSTSSSSTLSSYMLSLMQFIEEFQNSNSSLHFSPTLPISDSGSPKKDKHSPLHPSQPQIGMHFDTLKAAAHFVKEYEQCRGYQWWKGESQKKDGKQLTSFILHHDISTVYFRLYLKVKAALLSSTQVYPSTQPFNWPIQYA